MLEGGEIFMNRAKTKRAESGFQVMGKFPKIEESDTLTLLLANGITGGEVVRLRSSLSLSHPILSQAIL